MAERLLILLRAALLHTCFSLSFSNFALLFSSSISNFCVYVVRFSHCPFLFSFNRSASKVDALFLFLLSRSLFWFVRLLKKKNPMWPPPTPKITTLINSFLHCWSVKYILNCFSICQYLCITPIAQPALENMECIRFASLLPISTFLKTKGSSL